MRKRINTLNASLLLNGVSYGEHVMNPGMVVEDVEKLVRNCSNTFIVRCQPDRPMTDETYCALAKFAKEKNLYFGFLYAYQFPPKGKRSHLNAALVQKLDELAGDLFLGEFFGEAGSDKAAKDKGYYVEGSEVIALQMPPQDFNDMLAAKENFVRFIRSMTAYDDEIGLKKTFLVEATALSRYEMEGGIRTPILEVLPGNPENLIPFTRGAAIGYGRENWGGFIANEWYGGYRHEDELKRARLELTYKYLYLSGANLTFLESGNHEIKSFGYDLDENSDLCRSYRAAAENFENFIENNPRPPCGPLAKVAFLAGNADGYTDFMGGSSWCQFGRETWGNGDAEKSWDILSEIFRCRDWHDPSAFAVDGLDLNNAPAYGTYDVIPVESPLRVLAGYDYLLFAGWNTMTEELYAKLTEYVRGGGVLFACAAHLNENPVRGGAARYICGGDWSELFGCKAGETLRVNSGVKFGKDSFVKNLRYPGTSNLWCDANYAAGFADYVRVTLCGGTARCVFSDSFQPPAEPHIPVVVEHSLGKGTSIFLTAQNYPGAPAVMPLYRQIVKAILAASHADADILVTGSDRVRFSLFYDDVTGEEKLYLLNTSYAAKNEVTLHIAGGRQQFWLSPLELKTVELKKKRR